MVRGPGARLSVRFAVAAALGAFIASSAACGKALDIDEEEPPAPGVDAGSDTSQPPPGCTPRFKDDFEGCACETAGAIRDCAHGVTGPKSACKVGRQTCVSGKWSACDGANDPLPTETCNDVDDDCDGIVDNGCECTEGLDLCERVGGGSPPNVVRVVSEEKTYTATDTVTLYVMWNQPIANVHLRRNGNGGPCAGGAGGDVLCNAGAGCPGWYARKRTLNASDAFFPSGTTTVEALVNASGSPGCAGFAASGTTEVIVAK
ncbi:MAG: hypothetical protein KF819_06615 [Labilithrix sp.]|nr:hypothetical protein [Labilithrix sp.]